MDTDGCSKASSESLLQKMIADMKTIDSSFIKNIIYHDDNYFYKCIENISKKGEVVIIDDVIFNKRCTPKKPTSSVENIKTTIVTHPRRISFINTKFADGDVILRVQRLREMSDLEYLFSLNGYALPFTDSTNNRSMYEGFFNVFIYDIQKVNKSDSIDFSDKEYAFSVLQETIFSIHIITELCIDMVECILEIVHAVNTRTKTSKASIDSKISIEPIELPILDHIKSCFSNENKAFIAFKTHKLISTANGETSKNIFVASKEMNWITKINDYAIAIDDAIEIYTQNCDVIISKAQELKNPQYNHISAYLNNVTIFAQGFKTFLEGLQNPKGAYQTCFKSGYNLLKIIDDAEKQFPIKYGSAPVTPRSKESSPRPG